MRVEELKEVASRRDQLHIMTDMLNIVQSPQRLTHVLYRSNMSYAQLVKYLNEMKGMGMVKEQTKPFRSFIITDKGKLFLEMIGASKK